MGNKIDNGELWDKRKEILYSIQNGRCGIENCTWDNCPLPENKRLKFSDEYISIDHKFQKCREGKSAERQQTEFGKMIDSLVNLRLVPNSCNVNRMGQARMSHQDAVRWEKILSMNLYLYGRSYADILNMKSDVPSDEVKAVLEEVNMLFNSKEEF